MINVNDSTLHLTGGTDAWEELIAESVEEFGIPMRQSALPAAQQISRLPVVPMAELV